MDKETVVLQDKISEYKYKFSIVMAVYNVGKYLTETVGSIIQQDIGFEDNVQLILVDDCSKDDSFEICTAYSEKYPQNIIAVQLPLGDAFEQGGVVLHVGDPFLTKKAVIFQIDLLQQVGDRKRVGAAAGHKTPKLGKGLFVNKIKMLCARIQCFPPPIL